MLTKSCFGFRFVESALDYLDRTVPDENGNVYGVDKQVAKFMFAPDYCEEYMLVGSEDVYMQQQSRWM